MENNNQQLNIQEIADEIKEIKLNINIILEKLDIISKETKRMDDHVSFVEGIYDNVKSPFHFAMNKISAISNTSYSLSNSFKNLQNK